MAHCFVDFRRCIQRKKCMLTARAQCFLYSSHLLWFAEFTGAHNESLQKTMLVMWLQRRDAPSVFHSTCHTRCEKYGIPNSNRLIIIDFPQFNWRDVQMYTIFGQMSTSYCCTMITLLHVSSSHITSHILYIYIIVSYIPTIISHYAWRNMFKNLIRFVGLGNNYLVQVVDLTHITPPKSVGKHRWNELITFSTHQAIFSLKQPLDPYLQHHLIQKSQ